MIVTHIYIWLQTSQETWVYITFIERSSGLEQYNILFDIRIVLWLCWTTIIITYYCFILFQLGLNKLCLNSSHLGLPPNQKSISELTFWAVRSLAANLMNASKNWKQRYSKMEIGHLNVFEVPPKLTEEARTL